MSNIRFLIVSLVAVLLFSCSQQKRYISYKVKEGESIRDIAERLDVETKDLIRLNPDVGDEPAINSVIIIPNPEYKKKLPIIQKEDSDTIDSDTTKPNETDTEQSPDSTQVTKTIYKYKTHTVKAGETVYRLTKQYNISKNELLRLNPEYPKLKNNLLSVGQVLKVKVSEKKVFYVSLEEDLKNHVTHTVKSKETLYSLTRFYNLSKQELIDLNPEYPELANDKLNVGQILRIRTLENKLDTDDVAMYIDTIAENRAIKLLMLLPFRAKEYDSISSEKIFDRKKNKSAADARLANMVTDFYMGAEIAVDSIKSQGVAVDFLLFDTGNRGKKVKDIINNNELDDVDVVIGPFYSDNVNVVADEINSPVIFPHFSKNQTEFSSSNIVKSAPDRETHSEFLVNFLKEKYNGETIFVVGDDKKVSENQVKTIVNSLKEHDSIEKIHVLKPEKGYIKKERFTKEMKPNSKNWIILTSDDNVVIADAINSMVVLPDDVTAQVFAIDKNRAYAKVNNNTLARIDFTYVTDNFNDSKARSIREFNRKYRKKNKDIPSEYSVRGFDITYDILMRLASNNSLSDTFKEGASMRLENKFDYKKKFFGITNNRGLFILKYNSDLSLTRLK